MAYTFLVAQSAGSTGASTGATTAAIDTTGATLLVAQLAYNTGTTATLSDSKSNTWATSPPTARDTGTTVAEKLYYCAVPTVGTGHTFSIAGTGTFGSISVMAFKGSSAFAAPFDLENGTTGFSTSPSAGSITPSQGNELVVAAVADNGGTINSIGGGFTIPTNATTNYVSAQHFGISLAYLIQTTAAAANPTWTLSTSIDWCAEIASFELAFIPFGRTQIIHGDWDA